MSIHNKINTKHRKPFKKLYLLLALVFTLQLFLSLMPSSTNAAATRTKIMRYEALRGLLGTCAGGDGLFINDYITTAQFTDSSYSPITVSQRNINVPSLLFDSTSISCAKALSLYYEENFPGSNLEEKRQAFIKEYYDTTKVVNDHYILKDDSQSSAQKLYNSVLSYVRGLVGNDTSEFYAWRDRIISKDFQDCWKWAPPDPANTPAFDKATDEQKKDPANWGPEDRNTPSNNVGWMAEKEITGNYSDGRVSCDEVKSYIFPNHTDLISFGDDDFKEILENEAKAAAAAQIGEILLKNIDKVTFCAADAGITPLPSVYEIAAWLAYNDKDHVLSSTGTEEQLNKFKACLVDNISEVKTELEDLGQDLTKIEENVTDATDGGADGGDDKCLASNDFVAWFVCPVLDFVDLILEKLAAAIQDWLRFDLTAMNAGDNGGGLYTAWNIFRSLSTILIMAGFLLALLVKGVKGE